MDGSLVRAFIMPSMSTSEIDGMSDVTWFEELIKKEFGDE